MTYPKKLSRVIVPHSKDCFAKGRPHEWSGIIKGHFWGSIAANKSVRSNHHIWHKVICNDPKCPGVKAVHYSVLINA